MRAPAATLLAGLTLAACTAMPGEQPVETGRRPTPDLARSGGVNRAAGTDLPMTIGCRALSVARALTRSTGMAQLSRACSAATRL